MQSIKKFILKYTPLTEFVKKMYASLPYFFSNGAAFPPLSAVLLLSYRCNCRCRMCFYYNELEKERTLKLIKEKAKKELTLEEIKSLIDDLKKTGVRLLTMHGGEPLVRKDFFEIVRYANSKNILTRIISNGALITKEIAEKIVKSGIEHVTFSVDGPEKMHDEIRGVKGTFKRMRDAIKYINEFKKMRGKVLPLISTTTTISSANNGCLSELANTVKDLPVADSAFAFSTYNTKAQIRASLNLLGVNERRDGGTQLLGKELVSINKELLKKEREKIKNIAKKYGKKIVVPSLKTIEKYDNPLYNVQDRCFYPWLTAVISPYGDVYPCIPLSFIGYSLGNVRERGFSEIWNGYGYRNFRRMLKVNKLLPLCSKCCNINGGEPA